MKRGRPKKLKGDEIMPIFKKKIEQEQQGYQPIQPQVQQPMQQPAQVVEPVSKYQIQEIATETGTALVNLETNEIIDDLTYKRLVLEKLDKLVKFVMG